MLSFDDYKKYAVTTRYASYQKLYNESTELKNKISALLLSNANLEKDNDNMKKQITDQQILFDEIEKLKKENSAIKIELREVGRDKKKLKCLSKEQLDKLNLLENTIKEQNNKIIHQKYIISELENKNK